MRRDQRANVALAALLMRFLVALLAASVGFLPATHQLVYAADRSHHGFNYDTEPEARNPVRAEGTNVAATTVGDSIQAEVLRLDSGGTSRARLRLTVELSAPQPTPARQTLFHYTDEAGQAGIVDSAQLNPSLRSVNPSDARYGDGQYLSDIQPGTRTCAQLSRCFLGQPFQGQRFTHYVEIDVTGLDIVKGRPGVYVNPSDAPL